MDLRVRAKRDSVWPVVICAAALAAWVVMGTAPPANAQGSIIPLSQTQISQYVKRLKLTEPQKPAVTAIMQRSRREGEAVLKKHGITGAGKKPGLFQLVTLNNELKSTVQWARAEVAKILTPTQMREFEKIYAEGAAQIKKNLMR